ncbi:Hypothetical predicted protein [Olea europaea subsp. europaea]|uniref:Uncharacterized protein n=1 Tax=Olea europaea subsp. europaea TaxID=158383 RepID=A0A8S0PPN2_OLEEU|nr:Hypothetical predicted protein [Olea europaea subsp. europaea]
MQNITAFGGTTKSWRAAPACYRQLDDKPRMPQLVEINGADDKRPQDSHKIDVSFHEKYYFFYYKRRSHQYRDCWIYFKGHSHGQLVAIYLNAVFESQKESTIPIIFQAGIAIFPLSLPHYHHHYLIGISTLNTPNYRHYRSIAMGSLAVIDGVDSCFQITVTGVNRAVPSVVSRQIREYLLESNGEIFLVFLISRKSINVVDDVEGVIASILLIVESRIGGVFDMETCYISPTFGSNIEFTKSPMWDELMEQ